MTFEELNRFIKKEDGRLRERFDNYLDEEKRILARTVKLMEELGELSDEVLSYNAMQRQEKLDQNDGQNLPHEFADVIITTWLLAAAMGVDMEKALTEKIKKIEE